MAGKIYLIPTPISDDTSIIDVLPSSNIELLKNINYFVVENIRTARRFISKCKIDKEIDSITFTELSEHTTREEVEKMIAPIINGSDCGLMSEAGVPAIADPGSELIALAHTFNIEIIPLVGPSSILLSLMASGMNGQSFVFHGYIPIKSDARDKKIKDMGRDVVSKKQTQIFIEAPYRNDKLFESILNTLPESILLCIASNITSNNQYIKTLTIREWKKSKTHPQINKIPTIFIIG